MTRRPLGRTGLTVSALSLGTVSLGVEYGIGAPGGSTPPSEDDAVELVRLALNRGITLIDTAPAYGAAERIVGRAAGADPRAIIATKAPADASTIARSLEASLRALQRSSVDILQIHNATRSVIDDRAITRVLVDLRRQGLVRVLGATVYDAETAHAVIGAGEYGTLQLAVNVLDQRMIRDVIPRAAAAGIGIVIRSAYLKGALTPKAARLPDVLAPLGAAAARARDALAAGSWDALPQAAMRFCLSVSHVSSVLAGVAATDELETALDAEAAGPLDEAAMARAARLAMDDDELLNPSRWPSVP